MLTKVTMLSLNVRDGQVQGRALMKDLNIIFCKGEVIFFSRHNERIDVY